MTPQEAWNGRKPGIAHLRVFGSKAYAQVPDQTRSKLDDKSKPFIFIGYDSNTKGYKLYDPTSQKTMISRDVEFDEEGVWDFSSDNDTTSIPPFGDPRIDEQIRKEQQEQTTPPASPVTSVGGSPPSFLNERATQRARNLAEVYDDTERINKYLEDNGFTKCPHEHALYVKSKGNNVLIVCLYVDDLIFTGNNPSMFEEFKKAMTDEFEMTDIGLMAYYLGVEVKQLEDGVFITQEHYAKEILKKFKMEDCKPINTPVECGVKLSKNDKGEKVDPTLYKSLVGSLRYLTCTRPDILYATGLVSRYMENPTTTHFKAAKRILRYIKGTIDYGLLYSATNDYRLVGYSDSDWAGDTDDRKSTSGYVFYMGDTAFTWMSKKQPIVTLSTCEAEYVAATFSVCHAIWLRSLLSELGWPQKEPTTICVDNKSAIALSKNPVFHNRSKHIDTRYHYIRECIANQEIQVEYVKSQDQVADIFTKPLNHEDFIKIRTLLGMTNQV
ncbi:hypothetical protein SASPL_129387 [Salvia splendens]|uniref:Reverse transcriptase Ty1/copia-type domain-containing protein n=1 Tax=Salvia splendens TaxID=180675 RepID=A0A8X8XE96_SALSN|nr:hypothetical protein SASPL_129387 [Salvia splendens]